jgi:hypothetical protein
MVRIISPILFVALGVSCAHNPTPSSRGCNVLNDASQLEPCVGKTVTIRGRVDQSPRPSIIGVEVESGPELFGKRAHAMGTLEKTGAAFALKRDGTLAKATPTN